jgi:hypothetical protein
MGLSVFHDTLSTIILHYGAAIPAMDTVGVRFL